MAKENKSSMEDLAAKIEGVLSRIGVLEDSADWAARLWRSAGNEAWAADRRFHPDRTIPADFVQKYVPEWQWLLSED